MKTELISRKGCHLCEEAATVLQALEIAFTTVDVDSDAVLLAAYTDAVPVVLVDGREIARAPIALNDLKRASSPVSSASSRIIAVTGHGRRL